MATLLRRCLALLRAPGNELAFAVRAGLRWSRGAPPLRGPADEDPFVGLPMARTSARAARALDLSRRFDLLDLRAHGPAWSVAANLALLENLVGLTGDRAMPVGPDGCVRVVDLGSGDFHYATALHRWASRHAAAAPREVVVRGIELDGHGVYRDGHSRADHARAHAALACRIGGTVRYEVADATRVRLPEQDVVTLLFPFLTAYPALAWGLPLSRWRPRRLLRRAVDLVRPGGWLVVANQTRAEFERLGAMLAASPVTLAAHGSFATDLGPAAAATADRIGSLWVRQNDLRNPARPG